MQDSVAWLYIYRRLADRLIDVTISWRWIHTAIKTQTNRCGDSWAGRRRRLAELNALAPTKHKTGRTEI